MMSCSFSERLPGELASCGTQALASSHSPCCRHLLKYSNRSCRDVSDSRPKGCMSCTASVRLLRSGVTTGEVLQIPYSRGRLRRLRLEDTENKKPCNLVEDGMIIAHNYIKNLFYCELFARFRQLLYFSSQSLKTL